MPPPCSPVELTGKIGRQDRRLRRRLGCRRRRHRRREQCSRRGAGTGRSRRRVGACRRADVAYDIDAVARRDAEADAELGSGLLARQHRADEIVERGAVEREAAVVEGELRARLLAVERARQRDAADARVRCRRSSVKRYGRSPGGFGLEAIARSTCTSPSASALSMRNFSVPPNCMLNGASKRASACASHPASFGATVKRNALPPTDTNRPGPPCSAGTHASEERNAPSILIASFWNCFGGVRTCTEIMRSEMSSAIGAAICASLNAPVGVSQP